MKGLDLRKFKKIASDGDFTTMRHYEGHEIKVAHKKLSKAHRSQLEGLPMASGGEVPGNKDKGPYVDPDAARAIEAGATGQKTQAAPKDTSSPGVTSTSRTPSSPDPDKAKADSIERQKKQFNSQISQPAPAMATGGEVDEPMSSQMPGSPAPDTADQIAADAAAQQTIPEEAPLPTGQGFGHAIGNALRNGVSDAVGAFKTVGSPIVNAVTGAVQGASGQPLAPIPTMEQGQAPASMPQEAPGAAPSPVAASAPAGNDNPAMSGMTAGMQSEMQGLQHKYEAEKMAAAGKTTALEAAQKQNQDAAINYDNRMAELTKERQAVLADKIDPDHFWANKSTTGKIGTVIGLLVGGLGGNDPSKFIQDRIEQDMDAQKTNKSNVLHGLEQQFQDTRAAADFHRVLINDRVSQSLALAEAQAATPMAKANLEMARGQLQKQNGVLMAQIGAQQTLSSGKASQADIDHALNTLRMVDPAKAKEAEQRVVPGVGVAAVPVNDKTREAFSAGQTFIQQMDQLEKFRQAHHGALIGAAADEGHRLAELARNSFRIAQGEGVFKAGSQQFNEKLIADPTQIDFFGKNKTAYADMKNQAMREMQNSAKVHGIKPFENSVLIPQQEQYLHWAKQNPNDPRAKKILQTIGSK